MDVFMFRIACALILLTVPAMAQTKPRAARAPQSPSRRPSVPMLRHRGNEGSNGQKAANESDEDASLTHKRAQPCEDARRKRENKGARARRPQKARKTEARAQTPAEKRPQQHRKPQKARKTEGGKGTAPRTAFEVAPKRPMARHRLNGRDTVSMAATAATPSRRR